MTDRARFIKALGYKDKLFKANIMQLDTIKLIETEQLMLQVLIKAKQKGCNVIMSIENPIKSGKVREDNFLGAVLDHKNKQLRVYTNDMLINRYSRDSVNVAKSFDKLCEAQMKKISELYSKSVYYIGDGFVRSADDAYDIGIECGKLLMNGMQTITGSVELLRNGYILQPGMLLRSVVETFSLISYILLEPNSIKPQRSNIQSK